MKPAIWTGLYAEQPLPLALRTLHGEGWTAFEASTEHLEQIEHDEDPEARIAEVVACLSELGLAMPQAHALLGANVAHRKAARRREDLARLLRHLDIAGRLGVENVVIHPGRGNADSTRAGKRQTAARNVEAFRRLGDAAGERGLRIGLENLVRSPFETPWGMLDLLEAIDHPAMGITLDTSHANVVGLDLPAAIGEWGPYLVATHISDNDGSGDQHRTPGNGDIDWLPVMDALRRAGYAGLFNLEIPGERHPVLPLRALKSRHARQVAGWLVASGVL